MTIRFIFYIFMTNILTEIAKLRQLFLSKVPSDFCACIVYSFLLRFLYCIFYRKNVYFLGKIYGLRKQLWYFERKLTSVLHSHLHLRSLFLCLYIICSLNICVFLLLTSLNLFSNFLGTFWRTKRWKRNLTWERRKR